jgi:hypothetical protein
MHKKPEAYMLSGVPATSAIMKKVWDYRATKKNWWKFMGRT